MASLFFLIFAQAAALPDAALAAPPERPEASALVRVSAQIIQAERIDFARQTKRVGTGDRVRLLVEFE